MSEKELAMTHRKFDPACTCEFCKRMEQALESPEGLQAEMDRMAEKCRALEASAPTLCELLGVATSTLLKVAADQQVPLPKLSAFLENLFEQAWALQLLLTFRQKGEAALRQLLDENTPPDAGADPTLLQAKEDVVAAMQGRTPASPAFVCPPSTKVH